MAEMVTVGGVRYRKEDAAKLNLTPDSKSYAKKIAENEVVVGTPESAYKETTATAAKGGRKAAGTAGTTATTPVGTAQASADGSAPADGTNAAGDSK